MGFQTIGPPANISPSMHKRSPRCPTR
jgi:hypothetical protein